MCSLIRDLSCKLWRIATVNYRCSLSGYRPFREKKIKPETKWRSVLCLVTTLNHHWKFFYNFQNTLQILMKLRLSLIIFNHFEWVSWLLPYSKNILLQFRCNFCLQSIAQYYQGAGTVIFYCQFLGNYPSSKSIALVKASSSKAVVLAKSIEIA